MAPSIRRRSLHCLIVERHRWETGGSEQQLQFVLDLAREFFGAAGRGRLSIIVPAPVPRSIDRI
jgi:hypothetical protein